MARGSTVVMASAMVANPYGKPRDIQPLNTICELCDRTIKTKDWSAHKNSKGHRQQEGKLNAKETDAVGATDASSRGFGGDAVAVAAESGWDVTSGTQDSVWGATDDTFGGLGFPGSVNTRSGGGGGACYGCGEEGHQKRDCPKGNSGGGRACFGCGDEGHQKRDCPKSAGGRGGCFNCGVAGHNKAECTEPLKPRGGDRTCYNCGQSGHSKADCTEPAKPREGGSGGQCYNCYEFGHRKSDCTNERVMKCRNCDAIGEHESRECPKPKDWTRVQCNNCKEFGHTVKRCTAEPAEETGGGWGTGADQATSGSLDMGNGGPVGDRGDAPTETTGNWADDTNAAAEDQWGTATAGGGW